MVDNPKWYPERDITKYVDRSKSSTVDNDQPKDETEVTEPTTETGRDVQTAFREIVARVQRYSHVSIADSDQARELTERVNRFYKNS